MKLVMKKKIFLPIYFLIALISCLVFFPFWGFILNSIPSIRDNIINSDSALSPIIIVLFFLIITYVPSYLTITIIDIPFKITTTKVKLILSTCCFFVFTIVGLLISNSWIVG